MPATVRQEPEKAPRGEKSPYIRVKLRMDLDIGQQVIRASIIAWHHPEAELRLNKLFTPRDFSDWDRASIDIVAEINHLLSDHCEPFPE